MRSYIQAHILFYRNIPRKAYYLATKVGRYEQEVGQMFDFTRDKTIKSVEQSLERLGVEYIDLIQVEDPRITCVFAQFC